jgi:hypothetical protein
MPDLNGLSEGALLNYLAGTTDLGEAATLRRLASAAGFTALQLEGTGSPEGVVSAPVGSEWIRTDGATLGDFTYQKRSGTGNTGWVVKDGDTGWRLLDATASAVDAGKFTLIECKLRRAGATVHLHMAGTKVGTTGGAIATLPSGFRVPDPDTLYQPVFNFTAKTFPAAGSVQANGNVYWDGTFVNANVYTFTAVWFTTDTWPATLPGTPA